MPASIHGAFDFAELEHLGAEPDDVLDFSVNSNPYGPAPAVPQALMEPPLDRYPDRETLALRRALSDHLHVPLARILVGNGTAELLWLVALAYVRAGDCTLIIGPTFGEYERVTAMMGGEVVHWGASAQSAFTVDAGAVARLLHEHSPRLLFVCTPNNPTGRLLPVSVLAEWAARAPDTLIVVDEAYINFAPAAPSAVALDADNLLVLRSMTKDYALAGLRLGYAVGHPAVIRALKTVQPPWSVNALAQAAGRAALHDENYLRETMAAVRGSSRELRAHLTDLGFVILRTDAHFFLMHVGDATVFRRRLMRHSIQVRDCTSFGLPAYVRIAPRRPAENERLIEAIRLTLE